MSLAAPHIDAPALASVLSEIADIASETLELQAVFDRVATAVRRIIPLDNMGVVQVVDGERALLHAATVPCIEPSGKSYEMPLTDWSPRWRPHPRPYPRIDDAGSELDPAFPMDAELLKGGVGSAMWEPFRCGNSFVGGVWVCSKTTHAFGDEHQEALKPIAALLGSAVEHWQIWNAERRRRERLDTLEVALGALAESLDVREVFERLSNGIRTVLPHDLLYLGSLDERARTVTVIATAGEADIPTAPGPFVLTEQEAARRELDIDILQDIPAQIKPTTERNRVLLSMGMRSWLKATVRLSGQVQGSIGFFHREARRYSENDGEIARRIADRIALVLSHQQLAEEAQIAAESRERAERLEATVETLMLEVASRGRGRIIGVSPTWKDAMIAVGRVASSDTTVLITGESGTGKEVISNLIHQGSSRAGKPFVAINCAALPEQLLESELFGHEKGAFTGAIASKIGRLEQAAGGTLFLDEIAEMSPQVQAKFLRVLEQREFQRVGGNRTIKADVRVIAATNRDLSAAITRQTFREDLYYRLNVFQIHIAPLRERPEDILPLAEAFREDLGRTMGRPAAGISKDARGWLLSYPWPGNVRELRNAIERAILMCDGGLITRDHLPSAVARPEVAPRPGTNHSPKIVALPPSGGMNLGDVERGLVEKALDQAKGNKSRAARLLGLTRAQLYSRIEKYGVQ